MIVNFIRHGLTVGNEMKRYIGRTDEELSQRSIEIIESIEYPPCDTLIVSPMKRCIQTAGIIYPGKEYTICSNFRECDFGDFEGKNYLELMGNILYQKWIDSGGRDTFPNGENPAEFKRRCVCAFENIISGINNDVSMVIHGGTIMSILENLCDEKKSFYEWSVENAHGYITEYNGEYIHIWKKF
ncbi:MAG: histidine phosphatase family protein [Ruminococcus sp.]|nr:histidine phosphatase family protein [Ruminococcus sp.]